MGEGIPTRLSVREGRKFALTVGGAFLALALIAALRVHTRVAITLGALGGVLILLGLTIPTHLGPVQSAWMRGAHLISKVTTPIVMGLMYFLVITPVGLLRRAFGANSLRHTAKEESYWAPVPPRTDRKRSMTHQF